MKQIYGLLSLILTLGIVVLIKGSAHAATINVVAGTDAIEENSQCQLSEAIQNINDQAQTNTDCPAGDGNDDTINLPTGTITLTADLPTIGSNAVIHGTGPSNSIVDGVDLYRIFEIDGGSNYSFSYLGVTRNGKSGMAAIHTKKPISHLNLDHIRVFNNTITTGHGGIYIESSGVDVSIMNSEIDHNSTASSQIATGITIYGSSSNVANIDNVNIHDNSVDGGSAISALLIIDAQSTLSNSSIANNSGPLPAIEFVSNRQPVSIINTTVANNQTDEVAGILFLTTAQSPVFSVSNSTITDNVTAVGNLGNSAGLAWFDFSGSQNDSRLDVQNTLLVNNIANGQSASCLLSGGYNNMARPLSSLGGNISDDNTCGDSFTHPTDQNNVDAADLHLGTLGDYGGAVPTIPLESGSIAIDAGVTVPGLTTDARGISRPQCSAYDSGAYEYDGTCPSTEDNDAIPAITEDAAPNAGDGNNDGIPDSEQSNVTSLPTPDGTYVTLEAPEGVVVNTTTITAATALTTQDIAYAYPLGLVSFTATTTNGATVPIALYFYTDTQAASFIARKYNANTKVYTTIPGAQLTDTTIAGKQVVKLTYQITDGGDLDQDNTTNGTIVDPVGLAQTKTTAPNTGLGKYWLLQVGETK